MTTTPESEPVQLMRRLRRQLADEYKGLSCEERHKRMHERIHKHPVLRRWVERSKAKNRAQASS